ncbi:UPF0602 protein C4orf47 homolog [Centruroides sculpturatus]|uniref:UPF0602 protein C4orf47 homolog n=1 Tax=Centruroides sculpturatus TaxID=218467 RepID=UPI000C6CDA1C|nr:UPF0602 protein C4orf47 homolog [Centruroides sculpturatus]
MAEEKKKKKIFKKTNADISAMKTLGMFSELGYIHDGGYTPVPAVLRQFKDKQMLGPGSKMRCGNQDGYFTRYFQRIFDEEAYTDIERIWRLARKSPEKTPFFYPPATPKCPSGKGSHYGAFSGPIEYFSPRLIKRSKREKQKPNFYTSPGKKGTGYGYPDLAINKTQYKHLDDPYDVRYLVNWNLDKGPFIAISPNGYFWKNPYKEDTEMSKKIKPPKKIGKMTYLPFLPTACGKMLGGMKDGCFSKYPKHDGDLFKELTAMKRYKDFRNKENKIFIYPEGPKSTRTVSNVKYNVRLYALKKKP